MSTNINRSHEREIKLENGSVIKITEAEFQNVVDLFKTLSDVNREIIMEAVNGSKVKLRPLPPSEIKAHVGKEIFVAVVVKEELQMKNWDFYYKLERVRLEKYEAKKNQIRIAGPNSKAFEIEPRGIFVEVQKATSAPS